MVDIYLAAKQRGKYPSLATDTEWNNCFSIYQTSRIKLNIRTEKIDSEDYKKSIISYVRARFVSL